MSDDETKEALSSGEGKENTEETTTRGEEDQKPDPQPAAGDKGLTPEIIRLIEGLTAKINDLESKLSNTLKGSESLSQSESDLEKEIELRKQQLAAVREGKIDAKYEPEILSRMNAAQIKKESEEIVSRLEARNRFLDQWNYYLAQAYEEFPELKDPNSELHKLAKQIVQEDPGYKKYLEIVKSKGLENVDYSSLDSRVNLRAAREAFGILERKKSSKPRSQSGLARTQLEGRTLGVPIQDELAKLEKQAAESGDPGAWQLYIKRRDQVLKAREK